MVSVIRSRLRSPSLWLIFDILPSLGAAGGNAVAGAAGGRGSLRQVHPMTGHHRYVFPNARFPYRELPMSRGTLWSAFRALDIPKERLKRLSGHRQEQRSPGSREQASSSCSPASRRAKATGDPVTSLAMAAGAATVRVTGCSLRPAQGGYGTGLTTSTVMPRHHLSGPGPPLL